MSELELSIIHSGLDAEAGQSWHGGVLDKLGIVVVRELAFWTIAAPKG